MASTVKLSNPDDILPKTSGESKIFRRNSIDQHDFEARPSQKQLSKVKKEEEFGITLQPLFLGISATVGLGGCVDVGFASHDSTYSIDFAVTSIHGVNRADVKQNVEDRDVNMDTGLPPGIRADILADYFVARIKEYQEEHFYRFIGAGLTKQVVQMSPHLPARLWWELDIVPLVFQSGLDPGFNRDPNRPPATRNAEVAEDADSMARKSMFAFGILGQPLWQVGYRNQVEVDSRGLAQITCLDQYPHTVHKNTWQALTKHAESLRKRKVSIAFFSSTPQGGGVALMRHALIRFLRLLGINVAWYVPKPKPEIFRITKTNHNILQGVAHPSATLVEDQIQALDSWVEDNADRFWINDGGPLAPRSQGGADLIIVDDHQMPSVARIAKRIDPHRPVIFRDHIQVRSDLADQPGSATAKVWNWVRDRIKDADIFISHPVPDSIPKNIDRNKIAYMPATTDLLDGLNKKLSLWNQRHYFNEFNEECRKMRMTQLAHPYRKYILQIARFDPSKGIPHVLASYAEFRRKYMKDKPKEEIPQLVLAGHGAIDDPDMNIVYDEVIELLEIKYDDIRDDVVVLRLGPQDQTLNILMSNAKVALQLSTREGFEVKVSEATMKGVPIIGTKVGGK